MKNILRICSCTPTPEVVDVQAPTSSLEGWDQIKDAGAFR